MPRGHRWTPMSAKRPGMILLLLRGVLPLSRASDRRRCPWAQRLEFFVTGSRFVGLNWFRIGNSRTSRDLEPPEKRSLMNGFRPSRRRSKCWLLTQPVAQRRSRDVCFARTGSFSLRILKSGHFRQAAGVDVICEGLRMPAFLWEVACAGPASGSLQGTNPRGGDRGCKSMGI